MSSEEFAELSNEWEELRRAEREFAQKVDQDKAERERNRIEGIRLKREEEARLAGEAFIQEERRKTEADADAYEQLLFAKCWSLLTGAALAAVRRRWRRSVLMKRLQSWRSRSEP
jgi:hypothetical protein